MRVILTGQPARIYYAPRIRHLFFCDDALLAVFLDESRFGDCVVCRNDSTFVSIDDEIYCFLSFFLSRLALVLFIHGVSRPVNFTYGRTPCSEMRHGLSLSLFWLRLRIYQFNLAASPISTEILSSPNTCGCKSADCLSVSSVAVVPCWGCDKDLPLQRYYRPNYSILLQCL